MIISTLPFIDSLTHTHTHTHNSLSNNIPLYLSRTRENFRNRNRFIIILLKTRRNVEGFQASDYFETILFHAKKFVFSVRDIKIKIKIKILPNRNRIKFVRQSKVRLFFTWKRSTSNRPEEIISRYNGRSGRSPLRSSEKSLPLFLPRSSWSTESKTEPPPVYIVSHRFHFPGGS